MFGADRQRLVIGAFFGQEGVVRSTRQEHLPNRVLYDERGADEKVATTLQREVERTADVFERHAAACASGSNGEIEPLGIVHQKRTA